MKISNRLEQALTKLYTAYHTGALHPECCKSCAVGNICDNNAVWSYLTDAHGSVKLSYLGVLNEQFGRKIYGYSPKELLKIEATFLKACGYEVPLTPSSGRPDNPKDKDILFNGLCATVEYLCLLDGVANVMDFSKLFETENNQPKYALSELI